MLPPANGPWYQTGRPQLVQGDHGPAGPPAGNEQGEAARLLQNLLQLEKRKSGLSHDVVGQREAVEDVFRTAARMDWRSFVQHRLPLLRLPDELRAALEEGSIPYSAALELKKVKDEKARKALSASGERVRLTWP
ncbi:hypothetical protein [Meiothermus taiwanensis]|uniref:hypothetical protein n=1 Tax=Meiothermus taiwanensis TaxID=172827 RepID=UPI001F525DC5|nr:hypothetical protein [Meiothermus taiwanensis]